MKSKLVAGIITTLVTVSAFAGCVETKSYDDVVYLFEMVQGSLEDVDFQLYDGKTIISIKFVGHDVPYYYYAPEHDLSGFYWHLNHGIGEEVKLMYINTGLDYDYLYDTKVNGTWFYG